MAKGNDKTVYAFSDGSAIGNPGPGGYGVVLKYGGDLKELSQGYVHTTNNRMELLGAIMALESLKKRQRVVLTTDSQYVINGIEKGWAKKWRATACNSRSHRSGFSARSFLLRIHTGQLVAPLIFGMASVAAYPHKVYVVAIDRL